MREWVVQMLCLVLAWKFDILDQVHASWKPTVSNIYLPRPACDSAASSNRKAVNGSLQMFHFSCHRVYNSFWLYVWVLNQWGGGKVGVVFKLFKIVKLISVMPLYQEIFKKVPKLREGAYLCSCEQRNVQMIINKVIGLNSFTIKGL